MMNSDDLLTSFDSALSILGAGIRNHYPQKSDSLCNKDWQKEIFSSGSLMEYQLSASGKQGLLNYYLSGNYFDHEGILPGSQYDRYTLSARLGRLFWKKLAIDIGYRGSRQTNKNNQDEYKGNRLIFEGINKAPCLECTPDSLLYNEYGRPFSRTYYSYYRSLSNPELPQSIIDNNRHKLAINTHTLNALAGLRINDHFHMDIMESFMLHHSLYNAAFTHDYYTDYGSYAGREYIILKSEEDVILFNHQVNLSYSNRIKKHEFGVVLAHRFYKDNLWWNVDSLEGTIPEHYSLKNSMAAYGPKGSVLRNMSSYIGHFSYNFRKAYFLSVIANISQVKEGLYTNYYSFFPSVSVSWDIAREKPLRKHWWINEMNLYLNWGISGNYPLNGLSNDLYEDVPYSFGSTPTYDPGVLQLANHHLKHENTREIDLGVKSSWLRNRVSVNASYYEKQIENLIILRDIPYYYGGGKQYLNIGRVSVNGYDLNIELVPVKTNHFTWLLQYNFSRSTQRVKKMHEDETLAFYDPDILIPDFIIAEEEVLGNIYGYKYLGKMTPEDWASGSNSFVAVQQEKFLNADSTDSQLTESDKVVLGNSIPDYTWNLTSSFRYKTITMEMVWYAAWGMQKYNATRAASVMKGVNRETNTYIADTLRSMRYNQFYESDIFVEDAGFIRLKTLAFHYSPAKKVLNRISMEFSLSFENLVTITKYKGYDPEATIFTDNNFSDNAIDRGSYPLPKAVYFSVNLTF
jgi:hypothetical protein